MDYLPQVIVEPSHERLPNAYLVPDVGRVGSEPNRADNVSDSPSLVPYLASSGLMDEADRQRVICDLFSTIFYRVLALRATETGGIVSEFHAVGETEPVSTQTWSKVVEQLARRYFNHNEHHPQTSKLQHDQILASLSEVATRLQALQIGPATHSGVVESNVHNPSQSQVLMLSLQCLVETLYDLSTPVYQFPALYSIPDTHPIWFDNSLVDNMLRSAGWDKSEINLLPKDDRFRYYLSFLRKRVSALRRQHSSAGSNPPVKQSYCALHVSSSCKCPALEVNLDATDRDINSKYYNLVSLSQPSGEPGHLELLKQSTSEEDNSPAFVAFSHVRSDGLGSSEKNALPTCQLEFLQNLSNRLLPQQKHPVPFYIDTLCVPLRGSGKFSALRHMQYIFAKASRVLVLDRELSSTDSSPLPQENLTRIRYSIFMQRLFTVVECAVSRNVYILFRNGALVSLNDLYESYNTTDEYPLLSIVSLRDRQRNTLTTKDFEDLSIALVWLNDDIHITQMYSSKYEYASVPDQDTNSILGNLLPDRFFLRRLLRLGFLALPRMRYFAEAAEARVLDKVARGILKTYRNILEFTSTEVNHGRRRLLPGNVPEYSSLDHVIERIEGLQHLMSSVCIDE